MATVPEAARAAARVRVICALCGLTDFIRVHRFDRKACTLEMDPPDAVDAGKRFSDHHIADRQMQFFQDELAKTCPEQNVRSAVQQWPVMRADTEIQKVIGMIETLILGQTTTWAGKCISDQSFRNLES